MHRRRLEQAIAERTHRVLGVPRTSVDVMRWDGDDAVEATHVHMSVPIGTLQMQKIRKWLFYLDYVIPGRVAVWTAIGPAEIVIPSR
jgi:hypothetical protein